MHSNNTISSEDWTSGWKLWPAYLACPRAKPPLPSHPPPPPPPLVSVHSTVNCDARAGVEPLGFQTVYPQQLLIQKGSGGQLNRVRQCLERDIHPCPKLVWKLTEQRRVQKRAAPHGHTPKSKLSERWGDGDARFHVGWRYTIVFLKWRFVPLLSAARREWYSYTYVIFGFIFSCAFVPNHVFILWFFASS